MAWMLSGSRRSDIRLLGAAAVGLVALASMGLAARESLDADRAFAMVRHRIKDQGYADPARPVWLGPVRGGGVALAVEASERDCHMCAGELSIFYFRQDGSGWRVVGAWPGLAEFGSSGGIGDVAPIDIGTANGAIRVTDEFSSGGCFLTSMMVVELTPQRPIVRLRAPLDSDDSAAVEPASSAWFDVSAKVSRRPDRPGLWIRYQGSGQHKRKVDQTVSYSGPGELWRARPAEFTGHCFFTSLFATPIGPDGNALD